MIWRKILIKEILSLFLVGVFKFEARRNDFSVARKLNGEDGRFVPMYAA